SVESTSPLPCAGSVTAGVPVSLGVPAAAGGVAPGVGVAGGVTGGAAPPEAGAAGWLKRTHAGTFRQFLINIIFSFPCGQIDATPCGAADFGYKKPPMRVVRLLRPLRFGVMIGL